MIDLFSLIKDTGAYRTVKAEKESGRLSHAYLILTQDKENLTEYLKIFAELIACKDGNPCGECRTCRMIKDGVFADLFVYPKNGQAIISEEVNELIEQSYAKPIESDKKIFILSQAQNMNAQAQNKLLKTLEEPPESVCILIGATAEFSLLPTVKSRVKKLEIPAFSDQKIFDALVKDYPDEERLKEAISCGDGTVGQAVLNYQDQKLKEITALVSDLLLNMKSSSDILEYSNKITKSKCDFATFLSVLELKLRDKLVKMLENGSKGQTQTDQNGFTAGALVFALESINGAFERLKFNANATMLLEWTLFKILEGKYKWQKL
ncbi:MAG: hypothetical protein J6U92_05315 [Clostridia bacterium]|nr:hypothetical protein [Clostridia bacterium]